MTDTAQPVLDPLRQRFLVEKLGKLLTWQAPEISKTIGPYDPGVFESFDNDRRRLIDDCAYKLAQYGEHDLDSLSGKSDLDAARETARDWQAFRRDEVETLTRPLPWYAGGFGHPEHVADFDYWSTMPSFSIAEATCLSIGIEPKNFTEQKLTELRNQQTFELWPTLQFLLRRHEQLNRQFIQHSLVQEVRPKAFLEWVERVGFEVHPDFLRLLKAKHIIAAAPKTGPAKDGGADKREVDMIAQLFTAMAIDYLGYDPLQERSPIPKEIAELAVEMGLSVSDDTVRKYLRRGAMFIPPDWRPKK